MSFVMGLDVLTLANLIVEAQKKEAEEMLWEKWLSELPYMDEKNFMPFETYKNKHFQQKSTEKTDEEIMQDAENILRIMNKS